MNHEACSHALCEAWPVMDNEMPVVGADGPTAQLFGYGSVAWHKQPGAINPG